MDIIKGSAATIPAELLNRKARDHYEWEGLEIGSHAVFTDEEDFAKIRSASTSFSKGTKSRPPRLLLTRTVDLTKDDRLVLKADGKTPVQVLEVWRLPDPVAEVPATPAPVVETPPTTATKK